VFSFKKKDKIEFTFCYISLLTKLLVEGAFLVYEFDLNSPFLAFFSPHIEIIGEYIGFNHFFMFGLQWTQKWVVVKIPYDTQIKQDLVNGKKGALNVGAVLRHILF